MKQTTKTENVNYFSPDAQAIITMANLMDMLIVRMNMNKTLQQAKDENYSLDDIAVPQFKEDMRKVNRFDEEHVYNLLTKMGFVPTGNVDIQPKGYEFFNVVAVQMEAEHIAQNPDPGDNLPESEEAMKQAEIASASIAEHIKTSESEEKPTYSYGE